MTVLQTVTRESSADFSQMSGNGQKRSSKWDLKEESRLPFEDEQENAWPGKPGWLSPEAAGGNRSKWSMMGPLPGRRGLRRDDNFDNTYNRTRATGTWDEDESYGTRMSPGLDQWRQQKRRHSPVNEWRRSRRSRSQSRSRSRSQSQSRTWSRSQSRSPVHGFRRESGEFNRSRSRSGISSQVCRDFAAGRCRRGNHCHFVHEGTQSYEDSWERPRKIVASKYSLHSDSREYSTGSGRSIDCCTDFLRGNCRRGASCGFSHHVASDISGKGSSNEVILERDNDRRHRDAPQERHGERETRRASDVPCKYFAAGNCRNGKQCRFSHYDQERLSPNIRTRDRRLSLGQNSENVEKPWNGPTWSDRITSDAAKLSGEKSGEAVAPEPRLTTFSADDRWGHGSDEDKAHIDPPNTHKAVVNEKNEVLPWKREKFGHNKHVSEQKATKNWLGDMEMSPEWNYKVEISRNSEHASLSTHEPQLTEDILVRVHDTTLVMPQIENETSSILHDHKKRDVGVSDKSATGKASSTHINIPANILAAQSLHHIGSSSNAWPLPSLNAVSPSEVAIPSDPLREGSAMNRQIQISLQDGEAIKKPVIGNANASQGNPEIFKTQNVVSGEQLNQLTNISASLVQLLANGQQLPQLFAACNTHSGAEAASMVNSEGRVKPDSAVTINPNQAVGLQRQYDFICDSIEPEKDDVGNNPCFPLDINGHTSIADGKAEISLKKLSPFAGAANGDDFNKFHSLEDEQNDKSFNQVGENSIFTHENNGAGTEESRKVSEAQKNVQECDPLENIDCDSKADESKKSKNGKGVRAFKFALVEYVKELLKPSWKEGQMSKDAYKNIVKKVVDKVTGTMQGGNIPQTQEKIGQYLSVSKPKLTKLVQAYVGKFQKDK